MVYISETYVNISIVDKQGYITYCFQVYL